MEKELRKISLDELKQILAGNQRRLSAHNVPGTPADLSSRDFADFKKGELDGKDFQGANLEGASFKGTSLVGAKFDNADLYKTSFQDADLEKASFEGAKNLREENLRGANLTDAKIPDYIKFETLANIAANSSSSRKTFLILVAACAYCLLTIGTTKDVDLFIETKSSELPIIKTPVPFGWFYLFAPVILLFSYMYFLFGLNHLWTLLSRLPAYFPDGNSLTQRAFPWVLNGFVEKSMLCLWQDRRTFSSFQRIIGIISVFIFTPAVITGYWLRYLWRHDWVGTSIHLFILSCSILLGFAFWAELKNVPTRNGLFHRSRGLIIQVMVVWLVFYAFHYFQNKNEFSPSLFCCLIIWLLSPLVNLLDIPLQLISNFKRYLSSIRPSFMPNFKRYLSSIRLSFIPIFFPLFGFFLSHDAFQGEYCFEPIVKSVNETSKLFYSVLPKKQSEENRQASKPSSQAADQNRDWVELSIQELFPFRADLRRVSFKGQKFPNGTDFRGADLRNADLNLIILKEGRFDGADLRGASLKGAELSKSWFKRANLTGANLKGAYLRGGMLQGAILRNANLEMANLYTANLNAADLSNANLRGANLGSATHANNTLFVRVQAEGADFRNSNFQKSRFLEGNLKGANFGQAHLEEAHFTNVHLEGVNLNSAFLNGTKFDNTHMEGAMLANTHLGDTIFEKAHLEGANLNKIMFFYHQEKKGNKSRFPAFFWRCFTGKALVRTLKKAPSPSPSKEYLRKKLAIEKHTNIEKLFDELRWIPKDTSSFLPVLDAVWTVCSDCNETYQETFIGVNPDFTGVIADANFAKFVESITGQPSGIIVEEIWYPNLCTSWVKGETPPLRSWLLDLVNVWHRLRSLGYQPLPQSLWQAQDEPPSLPTAITGGDAYATKQHNSRTTIITGGTPTLPTAKYTLTLPLWARR